MKDKIIFYNTDEQIEYFIEEYSKNKKPIEVSFKALLPDFKNTDRFTHLIHSYPAKLLAHIPYFFINNNILSKKGDFILDPFCGTGTVLLEAALASRNSIGADANPLARLIAEVKVKKYDKDVFYKSLHQILGSSKMNTDALIPNVVNRNYWFSQKVQSQLSKLLYSIKKIENDSYRKFFMVCFSNCIKKVSYADPRIAVPVKLNPNRFTEGSKSHSNIIRRLIDLETIDVFGRFENICIENFNRHSLLNISDEIQSNIVAKDARYITENLESNKLIPDESINLIITSPPYAGAQKYIRSSSLNIGWLEFCEPEGLRKLDNFNIGRENYSKNELIEIITGIESADKLISEVSLINKTRAHIVGNYLIEMKEALNESVRLLKKNGYLVLIIGNNKVCNFEFNTQHYLSEYLVNNCGLTLIFKLIDDIKSYGLMTKRNKTADIISREWILVFKK
jgi:DNA modification methylase